MDGLFRGICVDNKDPMNLGRVRVQVPQILGTSASGWAFPAWAIHSTTVWPTDRLPNPGDGVWVMFDSTSPDKMIWMATFGPQDLINQPGFVPDVEYDTTLTMTMVGTPEWNKHITFQGVLASEEVVPNPNPVIHLTAKVSGGAWEEVASTYNVDKTTGEWEIVYLITTPGVVDYQAVFPGLGPYGPSISGIIHTDTASTTVTSAPVLPVTMVNGTGFTVSGTVKTTAGDPVTAGTCALWWRNTVGTDTAWKIGVADKAVVNGTYSLTQATLNTLGPTEWQVRYTGGTKFISSNSAAVAGTVTLKGNGALTKGAVSHTSAAFSWVAVTGATAYDVERQTNKTGAWTVLATRQTGLSYSNTSLTADTTYSYRVRPAGQQPGGTWVYGAYSSSIHMNTGHPEVKDTGSTSSWVTITCQADDSYRDDSSGWGAVSDMRQGYYSTPYGADKGYTGMALYDGGRIKDALIAAMGGGSTGSTRQSNGTCTNCEIYLTRVANVGDYNDSLTASFYTSTTTGSGDGKPDRQGTVVNKSSSTGAAWYDIGTAHGQRLGDAGANSVTIYRNDSAHYQAFTAGDLRLKWKWDYVKTSLKSPAWE